MRETTLVYKDGRILTYSKVQNQVVCCMLFFFIKYDFRNIIFIHLTFLKKKFFVSFLSD